VRTYPRSFRRSYHGRALLLVNAEMYTHAPQPVAAFPAAEIVGHGRTNSERQVTLSEGDECGLIAETTAAIEKHSGTRPRGWLGPWISQSPVTPDLLQEARYSYLLDWCHDDQPVWLNTRQNRILSVPTRSSSTTFRRSLRASARTPTSLT
jgi:allantoinase